MSTSDTPRKTVVTGGGGFVGRHLVDALRARGDEVTVIEFSGEAHRSDVTWVPGDVRDAEVVGAACEGADTVFHNASIVHTRRNRQHDVWSVNLDGTRVVLKACQDHGVPRLVYVSSASAVYEGRDIRDGDEGLPYSRVSQAPYADSKIAAEKLVLAANGEAGVSTCAIRPHVVFGPGDTRFLPAILERARKGRLKFAVGSPKKLSDFTYVDNLTDALLAASERLAPDSPVAGQAYFVTNGEPMPFFGFVEKVIERLDLPKIKGRVPYAVAWTVAAIAEGVDTLRGGTLGRETGLSRFAVRYMCTDHYFSIEKARRDLGYEPKVSLAEGIERTCAAIEAAERGAAGQAAPAYS